MNLEWVPARTSATRLRQSEYTEQARQGDPCKPASFLNLTVRLAPFTVVLLKALRHKDSFIIVVTMVEYATTKGSRRKGLQVVAAEAITQALRRVRHCPPIMATIMDSVVLLRKDHLVAAAEARRHQKWI